MVHYFIHIVNALKTATYRAFGFGTINLLGGYVICSTTRYPSGMGSPSFQTSSGNLNWEFHEGRTSPPDIGRCDPLGNNRLCLNRFIILDHLSSPRRPDSAGLAGALLLAPPYPISLPNLSHSSSVISGAFAPSRCGGCAALAGGWIGIPPSNASFLNAASLSMLPPHVLCRGHEH